MRRIATATAVGVLAVGLAAAPGVLAKKGPKQVGGTVTVTATPSTIEATTTTVAASGNVKASSGCRKGRTVRFSYVSESGTTPLAETAVTRSNGDFSATLPRPLAVGPSTVTLVATVDQETRKLKGKGKKKGHAKGKARKFNCLTAEGRTVLTVPAPPAEI
ncbi:MAG: hypothetical protein ACXWF9_02810 [Solirubrobacterales bacterium]